MTAENKLVNISPAEWITLRDLYKIDWPKNCVGFYTIDNFIKWNDKKPNIRNLNVYSLNGDWQNDGTFLIVDRYQLFINSLNTSNERLKCALSLLDWTNGFKISSFLDRHRSAVTDVIDSKQLQREFDSTTTIFHLSQHDAQQLDITPPQGITLRPLTKCEVEYAEKVWPNRHPGSDFFLKRLAAWNPNIGAFINDKEMVAWCFVLQAGPLGALQTDEKHTRKGYGSLVCKTMTHMLATKYNMDTTAFVGTGNVASQEMFTKIGFKHISFGHWLRTYPTVPFAWTDDKDDWDDIKNFK